MERAFAATAASFAVFYVLAFRFNWAMFTYFPALDEWHWGVVPGGPDVGPPMYWYGWIAYGILVAAAAGGLALLVPARATAKLWPAAAWAVPLAAMAYMAYEGRHWFTFDLANLPQ